MWYTTAWVSCTPWWYPPVSHFYCETYYYRILISKEYLGEMGTSIDALPHHRYVWLRRLFIVFAVYGLIFWTLSAMQSCCAIFSTGFSLLEKHNIIETAAEMVHDCTALWTILFIFCFSIRIIILWIVLFISSILIISIKINGKLSLFDVSDTGAPDVCWTLGGDKCQYLF